MRRSRRGMRRANAAMVGRASCEGCASKACPHALLAHPSHDARPTIAAFALRMPRRDLRIEHGSGHRAIAGRSRSPLAIAATRHTQLTAHPRHVEPVAVRFDPGVLHRDSFAKYAAAF